ncbi:hypothetical protein K1T73_07870 [Roseovarius sp. SCSIO 43702]|uniref:hypothetical protein n=1 Tax=Roseovarius sp. SCSIO 43702 TaxID=2823043 RepID=UPI001C72AA63|nr:hypothetical protein [Roseovarius sp. SCSIO 43702]QYX58265.1 hypothetical protein K1T73_07870 [Roseovarius sp. SCSIO 43702]
MKHRLATFAILAWAGSAAAQPVADPNGHVSGQFGGTELDMPALCEKAPIAVVRTHDGADAPGVEIALPGRVASIEVRTGDATHQFGKTVEVEEFPVTLEGTVDGVDYALTLDCPADFAD